MNYQPVWPKVTEREQITSLPPGSMLYYGASRYIYQEEPETILFTDQVGWFPNESRSPITAASFTLDGYNRIGRVGPEENIHQYRIRVLDTIMTTAVRKGFRVDPILTQATNIGLTSAEVKVGDVVSSHALIQSLPDNTVLQVMFTDGFSLLAVNGGQIKWLTGQSMADGTPCVVVSMPEREVQHLRYPEKDALLNQLGCAASMLKATEGYCDDLDALARHLGFPEPHQVRIEPTPGTPLTKALLERNPTALPEGTVLKRTTARNTCAYILADGAGRTDRLWSWQFSNQTVNESSVGFTSAIHVVAAPGDPFPVECEPDQFHWLLTGSPEGAVIRLPDGTDWTKAAGQTWLCGDRDISTAHMVETFQPNPTELTWIRIV